SVRGILAAYAEGFKGRHRAMAALPDKHEGRRNKETFKLRLPFRFAIPPLPRDVGRALLVHELLDESNHPVPVARNGTFQPQFAGDPHPERSRLFSRTSIVPPDSERG